MIRTYSELMKLKTFQERFEYLKLNGTVGDETFGFDRYLNQKFYRSPEWKRLRRQIIVRDLGCDLGIEGFDIFGKVIIHHMNPLNEMDIIKSSYLTINPEYLICTSMDTHNAIHFGTINDLYTEYVERVPFDTCPWKT